MEHLSYYSVRVLYVEQVEFSNLQLVLSVRARNQLPGVLIHHVVLFQKPADLSPMPSGLTCFSIGPYVVSKDIRKSILNQTEILRAIPEGPAFVIHCSWILNISVSSFTLTLQLLLQLALRCINTLRFSLCYKTFLWLYFPKHTFICSGKRFSSRGKKSLRVYPTYQNQQEYTQRDSPLPPVVTVEPQCLLRKRTRQKTLSSLAVVLCCPLTGAPCSLIIELLNGEKWSIQLWTQVVVQITTKELCQDSSRALSLIQCSFKKIKIIVTFVKFFYVLRFISTSNLFSPWWNKMLCHRPKFSRELNFLNVVVRVHFLPKVLPRWGFSFSGECMWHNNLSCVCLCFNTLPCLSLFFQLRNQGQVRGTSAASDEWRGIWPVSCSVDVSQTCACDDVLTCTGSQPRVYICLCVCRSVAVCKTHVEPQVEIHTLVYICTYKHTKRISTISPKYCTYLQQECKRKYFQYIYLEQILIIIRVIPLMDKLTAM